MKVNYTEVKKALTASMTMTADPADPYKMMVEISNGDPSYFVFAAISMLRSSIRGNQLDDKNIKDAITMLGISQALSVKLNNNKGEEEDGSTEARSDNPG